MGDIWEPVTFDVGDRVRVLARPECEYCSETGEAEEGAVGTVSHVDPPDTDRLSYVQWHPYWVTFDVGIPTPWGEVMECNTFAAIELVRIDG